jgi:hypothetical protein
LISNSIRLIEKPEKTGEIAVERSGPFRFAIKSLEFRPIVGVDNEKVLRVDGKISIEPRLRALFATTALADLKASANHSIAIPTWNPMAKYDYAVPDGGHEIAIEWDFAPPPRNDLKTLSLTGRLRFQIAAATEQISFDGKALTKGALRRRGGVSVRLRDLQVTELESGQKSIEIGVAVNYETGGPAFESHRTWVYHNAAYLEAKDGTRIPFDEFDTAQQIDGGVSVTYRWRSVESADKFIYEAPTLIVDIPVDFKFDEIPIPELKAEQTSKR